MIRRLVVVMAGLLLLLGSSLAMATVGSRVSWQGGSWYLQGVNVPWYNWGTDFGGGANGVARNTALAPVFAQVQASGSHVVRWWVFPGNPWQVTLTGLNPAIYADFDAALRLAETYDLYYDFVLFSAPTALPATWLTDPTQRAQLAAALTPLFSHYRDNPRVLSWEVFNEPEYDIWNNKIAAAPVQATVRDLAAVVHANSPAYVTVGSAMLDGLPLWKGLGLDYYQAHWYDYMASGNWCARCTDYAAVQTRYNLDAPLVIGEFYAAPDTDALARFNDFYAKGYAGAWPWSLFPDRTNDHLAVDLTALGTFTGAHTDVGPRGGSVATSTMTPLPNIPTATALPRPSPTPCTPPQSRRCRP